VGRDYPFRQFVADLRHLADEIEFNRLPGPADQVAVLGDDDWDVETTDANQRVG
jgi:hypothetical protein